MKYQRAYFPMKTLNLTQGYGSSSSSHKYSYALDLAGKDSGKDEVYAPFDCKVTKVWCKTGSSYEVWLESTIKVLCVNGYYGYLTMSITHPTEIKNMKVGQKFNQGDFICYEGKEGNAAGNHIHLELSKGKNCSGWDKINGSYVNKNRIKPEEYLFAKEDSTVKKNVYKGKTYNFIKESDITYEVANVPSEPLLVHSKANYKDTSVIKNAGLNNGDEVIRFYDSGSLAYIYHEGILGYTSKKYLTKKG